MIEGAHLSTRQYILLLKSWVALIGLEPAAYGTHSLRRTKVAMLCRKTGNLRACQLLLGHTKLESTVRYLGVELDDALALPEALEIWSGPIGSGRSGWKADTSIIGPCTPGTGH